MYVTNCGYRQTTSNARRHLNFGKILLGIVCASNCEQILLDCGWTFSHIMCNVSIKISKHTALAFLKFASYLCFDIFNSKQLRTVSLFFCFLVILSWCLIFYQQKIESGGLCFIIHIKSLLKKFCKFTNNYLICLDITF